MINRKINVDITKYENIYVMSDIHGHYNEFLAMLDKINFNDKDLLVVIGDTTDRGYNNLGVLNHCLNADNIILLMGNHEKMMTAMTTCEIEELENWLYHNGGNKTYLELMSLKEENMNEYKDLMAKIYNLPHYMEIDINNNKYLLVHAGIRGVGVADSIDKIMSFQGTQSLWIRRDFLKSKISTPFTVIFGHTATYTIDYEINNSFPEHYLKNTYNPEKIKEEASKSKIWYGKNKIGIDCGLYSGGKLACLRLNDMKEFYVDKIE